MDCSAFAKEDEYTAVTTVVNMGLVMKLVTLAAIDFYATGFFIGIAIKYKLFEGIPEFLNPLASSNILLLFGTLYTVEFFLEKAPMAPIAWNWAHVIVKPIAVLIFLLAVAYKVEFSINFFTVLFAFITVIIVSFFDAKIWTFLGLLPGIPIIATLLEDIIIVLVVSKTIMPDISA
jgi:hypothetical protein